MTNESGDYQRGDVEVANTETGFTPSAGEPKIRDPKSGSNDSSESLVSPQKSTFDEFQLEEYQNISTAHFESLNQITSFFRYYILILAAPAFIFGFLQDDLEGFLSGQRPAALYHAVSWYLLLISLIGFFLFAYIVNLRHDAVLYAKTVNKTRKYFYEHSPMKLADYTHYLTLPTVSSLPRYGEKTFFLPILLFFATVNAGFSFAALSIKSLDSPYFGDWLFSSQRLPDVPISPASILCFVLAILFLHGAHYWYAASNRNNTYLRSYKIGIDIDGVINDQTDHFIRFLSELTGKSTVKEKITNIPVHLSAGAEVSRDEERVVFHTKEYWQSLPVKNNAELRIAELRKALGLKVWLFSYRDWPQYRESDDELKKSISGKNRTPLLDPNIRHLCKPNTWKMIEIPSITKKWLKANKISHDELILEKGNPHISDNRFKKRLRSRILRKNRFQATSKNHFRFFVEDNPENAIKIASYVDFVFLFDEPYNRDESWATFPKNVIRVRSWDELYVRIKLLI